MTNDEILSLLQEALEFTVPEEKEIAKELNTEKTLGEAGISSIVAFEMAGYVEEKLEIQFADDELARINTVEDFINLIHRYSKIFNT